MPSSMDNLTYRRLLVAIGILIIIAGSILFAYGIYTRNNLDIGLGIVCVVVAYLISNYVMRLKKRGGGKQGRR